LAPGEAVEDRQDAKPPSRQEIEEFEAGSSRTQPANLWRLGGSGAPGDPHAHTRVSEDGLTLAVLPPHEGPLVICFETAEGRGGGIEPPTRGFSVPCSTD